MATAYISYPLTNAPLESLERYEEIGKTCEAAGLMPYLPHVHTHPQQHWMISPREVYLRDYSNIAKANIMVALVDQPSHGVGMELEIAARVGTHVILMYSEGTIVSRMVLGHPSVIGTIVYASWTQGLMQLQSLLHPELWSQSHVFDIAQTRAAGLLPLSLPGSYSVSIRFLLPLTSNQGQFFDENVFAELEQGLSQRFCGWTRVNQINGGWVFQDQVYRDNLCCYEVVMKQEDFSYNEFMQLKQALAQKFDQIEIFMTGTLVHVL